MFEAQERFEIMSWNESEKAHFFVDSIRDITKAVAAAVMKEAIKEGLVEGYRDKNPREMADMSEVNFKSRLSCWLFYHAAGFFRWIFALLQSAEGHPKTCGA